MPTTLTNIIDAVKQMSFQLVHRSFEDSQLLFIKPMSSRVSQVDSSSLHSSSQGVLIEVAKSECEVMMVWFVVEMPLFKL